MNEIKCPVCGKAAQIKRISKAFDRGEALLVIEDIPFIACRHCHEQYITAQTLQKIDALRGQRQHKMRNVYVERFAG
jgi:YgiT-type zinc finger domain-containing protein